jgi:hypothetical protein
MGSRGVFSGVRALGIVLIVTTIGVLVPAGAADAGPVPNLSDLSCVVPPLPHGVAASSSRSDMLAGPAVTALTGGAAHHGFALDGRDLVVEPPRPQDVPVVTADQAICGAMASTAGLSGDVQQGVAVGYGRVSVAATFFPAITGFPYAGSTAAQNPTVTSFTDRLAWVVVVHTNYVAFSCPLATGPSRPARPRASDHGYEVFMIDARTGTDAIVYKEGGPGGCRAGERVPPVVSAAEESVSVPWTIAARNPDGYSATISATVLPCDEVPTSILLDPDDTNAQVRVTRPFGPPCGTPETVHIGLDATDVTDDLPAVIGHDPVGLTNLLSVPTRTTPATPTTTTTTSPGLVSVDASMNGRTLDLTVGQVVALQPLPGSLGSSLNIPAVSSDPAVLGPLTSNPQPLVAEFRAWKAGTAEITVPQSACAHRGSDQVPCDGAFVLAVVVH